MTEVVKRYPLNTSGRDWIVGDVHGAFDLVWAAMLKVGFDRKVDRLFVVGDLVDRGEQSMRARRFLDLPFVAAVRGNHEDYHLDLNQDGSVDPETVAMLERVRPMGAKWWLNATPVERAELIVLFAELPLAIEIETTRGLVGIVHADVPRGMPWQQFTDRLRAGDDKTIQTALWGRNRFQNDEEQGVVGIDRLFVGHTVQWHGARRLGNVYCVDTGAIFGVQDAPEGGHLTIMEAIARTGAINIPTIHDMIAVIDAQAAEDEPFGSYAQGG